MTVSDSTISNNTALLGAGIFLKGFSSNLVPFSMSGSSLIDGNKNINCCGAGIYSSNANITIDGGTISNNSVSMVNGTGGAISINQSTIMTINGGKIVNNVGWHASAISCKDDSVLTMNGGEISNNKADVDTIIPWNGGKFILNGGQIKNNQANSDGGISVGSDGVFTYKSGVVCGNTPTNRYETSTTCPN